MDNMIAYIFGTLHNNELDITKLAKVAKKQKNCIFALTLSVWGLAWVTNECAKKIKSLEEKIEKLSVEEPIEGDTEDIAKGE
jgi:hypothetical protein